MHVYARLTGFGLTVFPRAPFRYERVPGGLRLAHESARGLRAAIVRPRAGRFDCDLEAPTTALDEVADVLDGPPREEWRIETQVFTAAWPAGLVLVSRPEPPGYDLDGGHGALVYLQGPFRAAPADERLIGPGQRVVASGTKSSVRWLELAYEHEGQAWLQRQYVVPFGSGAILVSTQAPAAHARRIAEAADELAKSIRPFEGDRRPLVERQGS